MSSVHGGNIYLLVSGMIDLLKAELPAYLADESSKIVGNFTEPQAPDPDIGYFDDVVPSRNNKNTISVFTDGESTELQFQGSVNEDSYHCVNLAVKWEFSCSYELFGRWKAIMYAAIKRAVMAKWKHYLGPAAAYHISVAGDFRSGSPRQQGTKSSSVFTALEMSGPPNTDNVVAIFRVKYAFSEDVSH